MGIVSRISDGKGSDNYAKVGKEGTLNVVVHPHPPIGETVAPLPFAQYFTDNGATTGSNNLIVNGSTAPIPFYVEASTKYDIYINSITIQLSDPGARLDRFGALLALTNGVKFYYSSPEIGELIIDESIKTSLDFFRTATGGQGFGDGTGAWRADISGGGGQDTYFPEIDLEERFGLTWGIRLPRGSTSILAFDVQDNLAGLSVFNIKAYGIII